MNAEYRGRGNLYRLGISIALLIQSLDLSAQLIPSHKGNRSHIGYVGEIAIARGIKGAPCIRRKESMD